MYTKFSNDNSLILLINRDFFGPIGVSWKTLFNVSHLSHDYTYHHHTISFSVNIYIRNSTLIVRIG